jgi:hypothetical protein
MIGRAAIEVVYFATRKLWYPMFQTGSYSINPHIGDPDAAA